MCLTTISLLSLHQLTLDPWFLSLSTESEHFFPQLVIPSLKFNKEGISRMSGYCCYRCCWLFKVKDEREQDRKGGGGQAEKRRVDGVTNWPLSTLMMNGWLAAS